MSSKHKNILREHYRINIEKSLIVTLVLIISLLLLFPRLKISKPKELKRVIIPLTLEDIPVTRQGAPKKPTPRPAAPVASKDDLIPPEVTIEDTELKLDQFVSTQGDGSGASVGSGTASGAIIESPQIFQPRPIFEVIPEYPEEIQKKGIEGIVKLHLHIDESGYVIEVVVLENTTNSDICAHAARSAALKGRYLPAKKDGKPTDLWITRTYTFGLQK